MFAPVPGTFRDVGRDEPIEGNGFTFSGMFGAGGRVGVEGEFTRGPQVNGLLALNVAGGTATYAVAFQDTLASVLVRYRGSASPRVRVEPSGGVTLAFGRGTMAYQFVPQGSDQPQYPWQEEIEGRSLGFAGGLDVLVPVAGRLAVGGQVRIYRLVWTERTIDGVGKWIWQVGAGVRMDLTAPSPSAPLVAATANGSRRRGYLGGFAGLFVQPVGEVDGHYLTEGVGGTGVGFGGTAGAFIHPRWSVAAEVAVGPEFTSTSSFAGRYVIDTRYRDTLISGVFRWHFAPTARVRVEPVVGATVAAGYAPREQRWVRWGGPEEAPVDVTLSRISFGGVGGADVVAGPGALAAVASFRLHVLDRNDARDGQPPVLGVGSFVYIIAGGLRWTF